MTVSQLKRWPNILFSFFFFFFLGGEGGGVLGVITGLNFHTYDRFTLECTEIKSIITE